MIQPIALQARVDAHIRDWGLSIDSVRETGRAWLAFGRRGRQPVVLKVIRDGVDEWRSGEILAAFEGQGAVRVFEQTGGAVLLERVSPGDSLVRLVREGRDDEATDALAGVIAAMAPKRDVPGVPTVRDWAGAFDGYIARGETRIPIDLVAEARRVHEDLCASQTRQRLLHGDLHHANVLFDSRRGWLAIDPKGVIGETGYELGAALRNPVEDPALFLNPSTIERRIERLSSGLNLDAGRLLAWSFSQAVLSAIWEVEDGSSIGPDNSRIVLAETIRSMLGRRA
ncbi:MAG: aminoglycoside phosphotransferase family protein [Gemmatimonadales bacterium]